MSALSDLLQALLGAITAATAVVGVLIAKAGLQSWRKESVGKHRMELAEDVLAEFYEVRDVMDWVRSPGSFEAEWQDRPGRDEEPEDIRRSRDTYYVHVKRLNDRAELFSRLNARRYRVMASFGRDAAEPYDQLHAIRAEIISAAFQLMRRVMRARRRDRDLERDLAEQERLENIIWATGGADPIAARLDEIVRSVEGRFRGEIFAAVGKRQQK